MFKIGLNRSIEEDDIYAVTDGMRSDLNTEAYAKLWETEHKKANPSIVRVILKIHGYKALVICLLYAICETISR